jgi:hypothetical protein
VFEVDLNALIVVVAWVLLGVAVAVFWGLAK